MWLSFWVHIWIWILWEFIVLQSVYRISILLFGWEIEPLLVLDAILRVKVSNRTHGWENCLVSTVVFILNLSLNFSSDVLTIFFRVHRILILRHRWELWSVAVKILDIVELVQQKLNLSIWSWLLRGFSSLSNILGFLRNEAIECFVVWFQNILDLMRLELFLNLF